MATDACRSCSSGLGEGKKMLSVSDLRDIAKSSAKNHAQEINFLEGNG
jgi:hypothetical protein